MQTRIKVGVLPRDERECRFHSHITILNGSFSFLFSLQVQPGFIPIPSPIGYSRSLPLPVPYYTVSQKNVPILKLSVTLSSLNRFRKFWHCWKLLQNLYSTTTLPWEIKNSNFLQIFSDNTRYGRKCQQIAFEVRRF